jgi:hypothetical protein
MKRREASVPRMWCNYGFIEKARYVENITVTYHQSFIFLIPSAKRYYMVYRLRVNKDERTSSHGCGVIMASLKKSEV